MRPWKTLSKETVLDCSKFLRVEMHAVELHDGHVIQEWPWLVTPDFINVVAVTAAGQFLCFRQTKYAVAGETLAPVGGYLEPGEEPLAAAKRELLEETGHMAERWQALGSYWVDANRGAGQAHLYLAQGARKVAEPDADDLEEMELILMDKAAVGAALDAGEFKVLPWAAAVALALRRMSL
ncbi:MAG: NUDIX hydrolase [Anaerolineaceae bacterium]|jgi:ADP-ribose pyrophosphatase|nr:NUDIX hydrolase [Anaerolineaceae bacterium]